jgi:hypothetical protein
MIGYLLFNFPLQELGKGLNNFIYCYPERVRIIDSYFPDDEALKYGITDDYWLARQTAMFSKKGVHLYCAFDVGAPWLHVANEYWFTDNNKGKHAHCEFTFLVWTKEKEFPEIFKTMNDSIQPVDLRDWNLYEVKPYRFIIPGTRFGVEPVLIEKSVNQKNN